MSKDVPKNTTKITLLQGDCIELLKSLPENSVDAVIVDGPYSLNFMNKKWDSFESNEHYMEFSQKWAKQTLRVLKPGGYLLSFSGSKTYHWMAVGIEKAGFRSIDMIEWIYGQGTPHGLNISKAIDKELGAKRTKIKTSVSHTGKKFHNRSTNTRPWIEKAAKLGYHEHDSDEAVTELAKHYQGFNTQLKPCHEPIALFQKKMTEKTIANNVIKWTTGGLNIDGCRVKTDEQLGRHNKQGKTTTLYSVNRKEHSTDESVYINNSQNGRYPANLIHDGSDEILNLFPFSKSKPPGNVKTSNTTKEIYGKYSKRSIKGHTDSGSSARFFYKADFDKYDKHSFVYCAKPSQRERHSGVNNTHTTVKPIKLMRYLARLITPPNGLVLDHFMGSGTTGIACLQEGFSFIGIEKEAEYINIAEKRIKHFAKEISNEVQISVKKQQKRFKFNLGKHRSNKI